MAHTLRLSFLRYHIRPLTQFACFLSALIHDADHTGTSPTPQLNQENATLAKEYRVSPPRIQRLVLGPLSSTLIALRAASTADFDEKGLASLLSTCCNYYGQGSMFLHSWWSKPFLRMQSETRVRSGCCGSKLPIVIEHLIQASMSLYTMQTWHIYSRSRNALSLRGIVQAVVEGRSDKDPSEFSG
jgi:hypothetical protein